MNLNNEPTCLEGKTILITGASDGLGRATALDCARHGATVLLLGKNRSKLDKVYDEIEVTGYPQAAIHPMDFEKSTPDQYLALAESIENQFGHLDGLINNAAWLGASSPVQHYDIELWYRVMQINLNAAFLMTKYCLPLLEIAEKSTLIFTLDDKNTAYWGAYGVSKSALASLMQITADEQKEKSVKVVGFDPGPIHTNLRTRAFPGEDQVNLTKTETLAPVFVHLLQDDSVENGRTYRVKDFISS